jgi:hypothetical protein
MPRFLKIAPAVLIALALLAPLPTRAADVVFPPGARVGIAPPPGMTASRTFRGYEGTDRSALATVIELPAKAYEQIEKSLTLEALSPKGFVGEKREAFTVANGKAVLFTGKQTVGTVPLRQWVLAASIGDLTAIINVQVRDTAAKDFPEAAIRTALSSVQIRPTPLAEQINLLPFQFGDLSGFRVVRVLGTVAAVLTDGPKDEIDDGLQPHVVVAIAPGKPNQADHADFARRTLATLPGFKEIKITSGDAMRIGGQQGYEMRASAINTKSNAPVSIVQWLRFGSSAYIHMVAVSPKDQWEKSFPRFRAIRDGLAPHTSGG